MKEGLVHVQAIDNVAVCLGAESYRGRLLQCPPAHLRGCRAPRKRRVKPYLTGPVKCPFPHNEDCITRLCHLLIMS